MQTGRRVARIAAAGLILLGSFLSGLLNVQPVSATHGCDPQDPKRICPPLNVFADIVCSPPGIRLQWTLYDSYHEVVLRREPDPDGQFPRAVVPAYAGWVCDTTALPNTDHTYRVCARYGTGDADEFCSQPVGQVVRVDTGPTTLPAPTITTWGANRDRVQIWWTAARSYNYYRVHGGRVGSAAATVSVTGAGTSGSYADRNVVNGAAYVFAVQGCGELAGRYRDQCSPWSERHEVRVDLPPLPLTGVRVESLSPSQLRVHWRSASDTTLVGVSGRSVPGSAQNVVIGRREAAVARNSDGYLDVSPLPARTKYLFEVCAEVSGSTTRTCQEAPGQTQYDAAWPPTNVRAHRDATGATVTWANVDDSVLWFEVERNEGTDQWRVISPKLSRPNTSFTDITARAPASRFDQVFSYRVCAGNVGGRTCSERALTQLSVAGKVASQPVPAKGLASPPVIRGLEPSAVDRFALRAGDAVSVRLSYDGVPTRAAFRVDAGPWTELELRGATRGPATVEVTVPASAFLQSRGTVDLQLRSPGGESPATIRVLSAPATPDPTDSGVAEKLQSPPSGSVRGGSQGPGAPKLGDSPSSSPLPQGPPRTAPGTLRR